MVQVSTGALVKRINRCFEKMDGRDPRLEGAWRFLRATRGGRARQQLGDWFVLDARTNAVIKKDVDLEDLGRGLAVLRPYEQLVEEFPRAA